MSEPPQTVKVGPFVYTVSTDSHEIALMCFESSVAGRIGQIDYARQVILLDTHLQARDQAAEALLHEVRHAVDQAVGIRAEDELKAHDSIVRTNAVLLAVLRENPALIAYLVGGE